MDHHNIDISVPTPHIDRNYSMGGEAGEDPNFEKDLEELRETFNSGKTRDASWRRSQLKAMQLLLKETEDEIFHALKQDLGKPRCEAYRDEVSNSATSLLLQLATSILLA